MTEFYNEIKELEKKYAKEFEEINHYIFEHPELSMKETLSARHLVDYISKKGFEVTIPYCGMDTAFCAVYGDEGPQIDFLAEYDALPGYFEDKRNGHACGHNWIAATSTGAAVVLAELVRMGKIKAKVRLIGTPGEEADGGKVYMVNQNAFKGTEVVIQSHLSYETCTCSHALAIFHVIYEFTGKASHAAGAPWEGINALDAVKLLFAGVDCLRQQVKPDVRIHGIVKEGGQAPNIIPDKASAFFFVRAAEKSYLETLRVKFDNIAKGAELMTGAKVNRIEPYISLDNMVQYPKLSKIADECLQQEGFAPSIPEAEAAKACGSTDLGNVSQVCPTMYMEVALDSPEPFKAHEESALALVDSKYAYDALHRDVVAMVEAAVRVIKGE